MYGRQRAVITSGAALYVVVNLGITQMPGRFVSIICDYIHDLLCPSTDIDWTIQSTHVTLVGVAFAPVPHTPTAALGTTSLEQQVLST